MSELGLIEARVGAPSFEPRPTAGVSEALTQAVRMLEPKPHLAALQAREILAVSPNEPRARFLLAAALRRCGQIDEALVLLDPLAREQAAATHVHLERGQALMSASRYEEASIAFERAASLKPDLSDAWLGLADCARERGRSDDADRFYARSIAAATRDADLLEAAEALRENHLAVAERLLRAQLEKQPTHVAALRMLGEVAARLGRHADAEALLARVVELAPGFTAARHNYALVLHRANKAPAALEQIEHLCASDPANPGFRNLKAAILARLGDYDAAIAIYEKLLKELPRFERGWLSYGHALKTAGRSSESIAAYRRAIDLAPHFGEAYWSLANMKTFRFNEAEITSMEGQLARADLAPEDRLNFHFALGKALEDREAYGPSFKHYAEGAKLRRAVHPYSADAMDKGCREINALFTKEFLEARTGWGCDAPDAIFVLGLPRAGSTLIEQILSSHSLVEGTMELPDLRMIAQEQGEDAYPGALANLNRDAIRALGETYIARTRAYRKTDRPFFIDKMPNNWEHAGFIKLILPNAKIIDARRHPMACCFSAFKQHFARGQRFSYDLEDLGRYYSAYVATLAHMDDTAPGAVHRVIYERMVADTETEVRALLAYCGLAFEPACLSFHENDRPVRTASSEQVRQPIFASAVEHWRHYEPWLGALKSALGPVLDFYPETPPRAALSL